MSNENGVPRWLLVIVACVAIAAPVVAAVTAYGVIQSKEGQRTEQLKTMQTEIDELKADHKAFIQREEMIRFMDQTTRTLESIQKDMRRR